MLWSLLRQSCNKFVVLQRPILCLLIFIRTHLFRTVRVKAIMEIFKNIKFNDVIKNFLAVLAENGKLSRLPQIISTYTTSVGSSRKIFSSGNCSSWTYKTRVGRHKECNEGLFEARPDL
ncbi:hypothetical protein CY35_07G009200 [Sphagnum magellanicum]|uniref:Uncharacterized protein n=1 Tax=Sphagnum magellanicum TaxID=128215 RepID=A0ACB8HIR1_9BRYO|nr:hypothetical protein CY35_07G009200 [Sphagnum magellanicum]